MARVDAGTDVGMPVLYGISDISNPIVQRSRPVIVDGDANVLLGYELIEALERVMRGIGAYVADTHRPGKVENATVCLVVGGEFVYPQNIASNIILIEQSADALNLIDRSLNRKVLARKLDPLQLQIIVDDSNGLIDGEVAKGVGLYTKSK